MQKNLVKSNELIKKDFNIDRDVLIEKKNVLIDLLKKKSYEVNNSKEKINPNNLVYE